jgi:hypothetical protein
MMSILTSTLASTRSACFEAERGSATAETVIVSAEREEMLANFTMQGGEAALDVPTSSPARVRSATAHDRRAGYGTANPGGKQVAGVSRAGIPARMRSLKQGDPLRGAYWENEAR